MAFAVVQQRCHPADMQSTTGGSNIAIGLGWRTEVNSPHLPGNVVTPTTVEATGSGCKGSGEGSHDGWPIDRVPVTRA